MERVQKYRMKISFKTQKYYAVSCLLISIWAGSLLLFVGYEATLGLITAGYLISCVNIIADVYDISSDFSEKYTYYVQKLRSIDYFHMLLFGHKSVKGKEMT